MRHKDRELFVLAPLKWDVFAPMFRKEDRSFAPQKKPIFILKNVLTFKDPSSLLNKKFLMFCQQKVVGRVDSFLRKPKYMGLWVPVNLYGR